MKIKRFEDLDVWKKARGFTKLVYELTGKGEFSKDWGLFSHIYEEAEQIKKMITGFIKYLKGYKQTSELVH